MKLTLADIRTLYRRYVPWASQHPSACERGAPLWWPAHEIGHLLTVPRRNIGRPMFGLAEKGRTSQETALFRTYELAAMSISRRLLTACGRSDLFDDPKIGEREASNYDVMHYGSWSHARRIAAAVQRENAGRFHYHPLCRPGVALEIRNPEGTTRYVVIGHADSHGDLSIPVITGDEIVLLAMDLMPMIEARERQHP